MGRRVHAIIGVPGSFSSPALDKSLAHVLGLEKNLGHARGRDESACASGHDAYNNFFAHPRAASLSNEYSDDAEEHDSTITTSLSRSEHVPENLRSLHLI